MRSNGQVGALRLYATFRTIGLFGVQIGWCQVKRFTLVRLRLRCPETSAQLTDRRFGNRVTRRQVTDYRSRVGTLGGR